MDEFVGMDGTIAIGGQERKYVAQVVPTFSMSCFKLPQGLCDHIKSMLWIFWWGGDVYARVCSCRQCWASKCRGL
jgi:hypothetical protein